MGATLDKTRPDDPTDGNEDEFGSEEVNMKRILGVLCVLVAVCAWWAWRHWPVVPWNCRQLLVVVGQDWNATRGVLQRYERGGIGESWRAVGESVSVDLGRSGLGWGRGLHPMPAGSGPIKAEGDGRAPAGIFGLTQVFAVWPGEVQGTGLPVVQVTPDLLCVDDGNSNRYNTMFTHGPDQATDWTSAETMLRPDGLYRFGVFVAHNSDPAQSGAGSCIFMHISHADGRPTSGCTAMESGRLREILLWLRDRPVLVQMPAGEYVRLASDWGLPEDAMSLFR